VSGQTNGPTNEDILGVGWQNYLLYKSVIITTLPLVPGLPAVLVRVVGLSLGEGGTSAGWASPWMLFELWSLECSTSRHCNRHPRLNCGLAEGSLQTQTSEGATSKG